MAKSRVYSKVTKWLLVLVLTVLALGFFVYLSASTTTSFYITDNILPTTNFVLDSQKELKVVPLDFSQDDVEVTAVVVPASHLDNEFKVDGQRYLYSTSDLTAPFGVTVTDNIVTLSNTASTMLQLVQQLYPDNDIICDDVDIADMTFYLLITFGEETKTIPFTVTISVTGVDIDKEVLVF